MPPSVDAAVVRLHGAGGKALGVDVGAVRGRLAAAQLLHEVERPVHGKFAGVRVHALFKAGGGIGTLPERARGLAHAVARELRRLEEHRRGIWLDLAVASAHDARKGDALLAVADKEVFGRERKFLFVERDDLLPFARAADDDFSAREEVSVERVHGLPEFEQDEVGDVHDVGNGAQSAQRKAAAHPAGRNADLHVRHVMPHIAGAERGLFHRDGNADVRRFRGIVGRGRAERLFEDRGDFARDPEHALAVGAVGGDGDVEQPIVQPDDGADILSDGRILIENENAVRFRAVVPIVVDAQLFARAEHTLARDAAELARLDLLNAALVQDGRAVERARHDRARIDVGRRRADLFDAVAAAVHRADGEPVRVGVFLRLGDAPRKNARHVFAEIGQVLHLESAGEELRLQFLGGHVDIHIIF